MASRMDRYHKDSNTSPGRSIKNKSLYKQIEDLDSYTNIEGVATIEKTNEIDISKVKELLKNRENYKKQRQYINLMGKEEKREEKKEEPIEEVKNYDVKDLLSKIKPNDESSNRSLRKEQYEALKKYNDKNRRDNTNKDSDDLKELLNTLVNDDDLKALADTNDVGLLDELKSNTMVGDASSIKRILDEEKQNIKNGNTMELDKSFYTSSFGFTATDFEELKNINHKIKKDNKFIIILLVVLILLIILGIVFFLIIK